MPESVEGVEVLALGVEVVGLGEAAVVASPEGVAVKEGKSLSPDEAIIKLRSSDCSSP